PRPCSTALLIASVCSSVSAIRSWGRRPRIARSKACRVPEPRSRTIQEASFRSSSSRAREGMTGGAEDHHLVLAPGRKLQIGLLDLALHQPEVQPKVGDLAGDLG